MSLMISEAAGMASMLAVRGIFEIEGPEPVYLSIWGGEMPTSIEDDVDAEENTLLGEFLPIGTVFGDPERVGDTIVADILPIGGVTGIAVGTASFFRLYDRAGVAVMQGSVGVEADDPVLVVDDAEFTEQKLVTVQSLRLIQPLSGA